MFASPIGGTAAPRTATPAGATTTTSVTLPFGSGPPTPVNEVATLESLEQYYQAKQYTFDCIHEVARVKEAVNVRNMALHESHATVVSHKVGRLVAQAESAESRLSAHEALLGEYQQHVARLNRAVLRHDTSSGHGSGHGGTTVQDFHQEMLRAGATPVRRDTTTPQRQRSGGDASALLVSPKIAELEVVNHSKAVTVQMLQGEIVMLREALLLIARKAEGFFNEKAEKAVEDLVQQANENIANSQRITGDKFLSQMLDKRLSQLTEMRNAQHQIDALKAERLAMSKALRKAEQEIVQMRLKMMERDSSMIVVSKRVKEVEGKLEEETATSAMRIDAAERLAGDLVFKYEKELRRLRDIIDEHIRKNAEMQKTVARHEREVEVALQQAEDERLRGIEAVEQKEREMQADCALQVAAVQLQLNESTTRCTMQVRQLATHETTIREQTARIATLDETVERCNRDIEHLRAELEGTARQLADRSKGPLAFIQANIGDQTGKPGTLVQVGSLVSGAVDDLANRSADARRRSLKDLASRFMRVNEFREKSSKAAHPKVASQVTNALQQLAAGMILLTDAGDNQQAPSSPGKKGGKKPPSSPSKHAQHAASPTKQASAATPRSESKPPPSNGHAATEESPFAANDGLQDDDSDRMSNATPTLSDLPDDDCEPEMYIRPEMADGTTQHEPVPSQDRAVQVSMDGGASKAGGGPRGSQGGSSNDLRRSDSRLSMGSDTASNKHSPTAAPKPGLTFNVAAKTVIAAVKFNAPMPGRKAMVGFDAQVLKVPALLADDELTATQALLHFETIDRLLIDKSEQYMRGILEGTYRELELNEMIRTLNADLDHRIDQADRVVPYAELGLLGQGLKHAHDHEGVSRSITKMLLTPSAAAATPTLHIPTPQVFAPATPVADGDPIDAAAYNALVARYEALRKAYDGMAILFDLNVTNLDVMRREVGQRAGFLAQLEDHQASLSGSKLVVYSGRQTPSSRGSQFARSQVVHVSNDDSSLLETVSIFVFDSQKYIKKAFLPKQKPLLYEGRMLVNLAHCQEVLGALLQSMSLQRDHIVADKKALKQKKLRKKKKKAGGAGGIEDDLLSFGDATTDEDVDFLATPQGEPLAPPDGDDDTGDAAQDGGRSPRGKPKGGEGRSKKGLTSSKTAVFRLDTEEDAAQQQTGGASKDADDDDEGDSSSDDDKVRPFIPKLVFPVDPILERMAIDAVLQPLLKALRRRLSALGLDALLEFEERDALAAELARGLDDPVDASDTSKPAPSSSGGGTVASMADTIFQLLVGTRVRGLQAVLSLETTVFVLRDHFQSLLSQLFGSFPKSLVQRVPEDFDPELAYELVVRVSQWWDRWSKIAADVQADLVNMKQNRLHRMIDLCELIDTSGTIVDTAYGPLLATAAIGGMAASGPALPPPSDLGGLGQPRREVVDLLHARAKRHNGDLLYRIEHPVLQNFSLHHRAKFAHAAVSPSRGGPQQQQQQSMPPASQLSVADVGQVHSSSNTMPAPTSFAKAMRVRREGAPEIDRMTSPATMNTALHALAGAVTPPPVPSVALLAQHQHGATGTKWNPNAKKMGGSHWEAAVVPKRLPPLT